MALNKVTYVDDVTAIHAQNLNEIQDTIGDGSLSGFTATDLTGAANELKTSLSTYVRPNLLDNWYFGNPVNQRGQNSYTGAVYGIDRWQGYQSRCKLEVQSANGCIKLSSTESGYADLIQKIPITSFLGKKLTFSVLLNDGSLYKISGTIPTSAPSSETTIVYTFIVNNDAGLWIRADSTTIVAQIRATYATALYVVAAKLELGEGQTLAHYDGAKWVLNNVPDYVEELEKCMQYFRVADNGNGGGNGQFLMGVRGYSADTQVQIIVTPPMRGNITPSLPDGIQGAAVDGAGTAQSLSDVGAANSKNRYVITTSGALARTPIAVYLNKIIWLSAEL